MTLHEHKDFSQIPLPLLFSPLVLLVFPRNTPTSIDFHLVLFLFLFFFGICVEFWGLDVFFSDPVNLLLFTEALFTVATLTVAATNTEEMSLAPLLTLNLEYVCTSGKGRGAL